MGAAAYRLPARWQDYARCTYAAWPVRSRATGPGAEILGWIFMYVCSEIKKLAFKAKTRKTEKL